MTEDDIEAAFRKAYLEELRSELAKFAGGLGLNETERIVQLDAVSRLFVRYESWPAYSAWRAAKLKAMPYANGHQAADAMQPGKAFGELGVNAAKILADAQAQRLDFDVWKRLNNWRKQHSEAKMVASMTEAEIREALT